jgi:hypothetical protein
MENREVNLAIFCDNCGEKFESFEQFCPNCGEARAKYRQKELQQEIIKPQTVQDVQESIKKGHALIYLPGKGWHFPPKSPRTPLIHQGNGNVQASLQTLIMQQTPGIQETPIRQQSPTMQHPYPTQNNHILQQPTPHQPYQEVKPKNRKKMMALILLGIILGSTAIMMFVFSPRNNQMGGKYDKVNYITSNATVLHGSVERTPEGLIILDLNGTYEEMGFAHGQLVGNEIRYMVEYVIQGVLGGDKKTYKEIYDEIGSAIVNKNTTMHGKEVQAIYNGSINKSANMYVPSLKRNWDVTDLWVANTLQDWNQYACSGVGIWGNASVGSKTMIGRDLDFYVDPAGYITQLYTIIIFRGTTSRNSVFSFGFPGLVGTVSAFNDKGVWISTDNSNGLQYKGNESRTPMSMCIRNFLEKNDGINTTQDAQEYFSNIDPYAPFLFLVGSNQTSDDPVVVLEGNFNETLVRTGSMENCDYIFMTNHQRNLSKPQNCYRYKKYEQNFKKYTTTGDNKISIDELQIMTRQSGHAGTINNVIFMPSTLEFKIGYTRIMGTKDGQRWDEDDLKGGPWDPLIKQNFTYYSF